MSLCEARKRLMFKDLVFTAGRLVCVNVPLYKRSIARLYEGKYTVNWHIPPD